MNRRENKGKRKNLRRRRRTRSSKRRWKMQREGTSKTESKELLPLLNQSKMSPLSNQGQPRKKKKPRKLNLL